MEWLSNFYTRDALAKICEQFTPEEHIIFVHGSLGDIYPNLALLHNYYPTHSAHYAVLLSEDVQILSQRFSLPNGRYVILNKSQVQWISFLLAHHQPVHVRLARKIFPTLPTLHPLVGEASLDELLSDAQAKRLILGLPASAMFDWGIIKKERLIYLQEEFDRLGLERNKTVIISFGTNSNSAIDPEVTENIIRRVSQSGMCPVLNNAGSCNFSSYTNINNLPRLAIPPDLIVEYHEYAGYGITAFSGLSLILSLQPHSARISVVAPKHNVNGNRPGKISIARHRTGNLSDRDFVNKENVKEHWYDLAEGLSTFLSLCVDGLFDSRPRTVDSK